VPQREPHPNQRIAADILKRVIADHPNEPDRSEIITTLLLGITEAGLYANPELYGTRIFVAVVNDALTEFARHYGGEPWQLVRVHASPRESSSRSARTRHRA
jgi:hypothetical protein